MWMRPWPASCRKGAGEAALGFIDSLEEALAHMSRHPGAGSFRHAHEVNLPGLRSWPLTRHPHLVFYVTHWSVTWATTFRPFQ
jgi:hypothetical protein